MTQLDSIVVYFSPAEGSLAFGAERPIPKNPMDVACPYCGFANKPKAVRCECCLSDLGATPPQSENLPVVAPSREAVVKTAAPPPAAAPARAATPTAKPAMAPSAPAFSRVAATQAPTIPLQVPKGGSMVLVVFLVIGLAGGALLILPQSGKGPFAFRTVRPAATPVETPVEQAQQPPPATSAPTPAPPAAAPGAPVPSPAAAQTPAAQLPAPAAAPPPSAPPVTAPNAAEAGEADAERMFRAAVSLLGRQPQRARQTLQSLLEKYPTARISAQARDLMAQIPDPALLPSHPAPPAAVPAARTRAPAAQAPAPAEPQPQQPGVLTNDDLRGRSAALGGRRKPVELPPSLQAAQAPTVQSARSSSMDEIQVTGISQEPGRLVLTMNYHLASQRGRPVFVGAWVQSGGASLYFAYTPSPVSPGRGTARVALPNAPANVSNIRVAFFEDGGARFFVKDVILPK